MIRRATAGDAAAIAAIHVDAWQAGYRGLVPQHFLDSLSVAHRTTGWRQSLQASSGPPASDVWVAEAAGVVTGWISVGRSRDDDALPSTAELWAIYISPSHWRQGQGRLLWSTAEAHLRAAGHREVTLWVLRENSRALAFYATLGFQLEEGRETTIERGGAALVEVRLRRGL